MRKTILMLCVLLSLNTYCQKNAMHFFSDGSSEYSSEDYNAAIISFSTAIQKESDPQNLSVFYYFRGAAKLKIKDFSGAIADYTKSRSSAKNQSFKDDLLKNRAKAKMEVKDYRGAISDYTEQISSQNYAISKAARMNSNPEQDTAFQRTYSVGYCYRGVAKLKLKDVSGALVDFDKAIEIEPSYSMAFYYRGLAKLDLYRKQSACIDFSKAGELGYEEAYRAIGKYCQ